jgi:hypothetical protein
MLINIKENKKNLKKNNFQVLIYVQKGGGI